jgi:hypothetical protein
MRTASASPETEIQFDLGDLDIAGAHVAKQAEQRFLFLHRHEGADFSACVRSDAVH